MGIKTLWFIAVFGLASVAVLGQSFAFQRTMTCYGDGLYQCRPGEIGKSAFWPVAGKEPAVPGRTGGPDYFVNPNGVERVEGEETNEMSEALLAEIQAGFERWNEVECSPLEMNFLGWTSISAQESFQTSNRQDAQGNPCAWDDEACLEDEESTSLGVCGESDPPLCDPVNIVVFRPTDWPVHYASPTAFAITSVNIDPDTGQIMDADIEFNLEFQSLGVVEWASNPSEVADIRNTATHEVGHFLGLDHSDEREATMYRRADSGEVTKRDLMEDDIEGLCSIYPNPPIDPEPPRSVPAEEGCCAVVASRGPQDSIVLLLLFLTLCLGLKKRAFLTVRR